MAETLTMMAVHAHPDDEASSTGGVLAAYSAQGIRTVVVTCTNGEFGDAPGGVKPGSSAWADVPAGKAQNHGKIIADVVVKGGKVAIEVEIFVSPNKKGDHYRLTRTKPK